jgi:PAS domain S-box-containing protein
MAPASKNPPPHDPILDSITDGVFTVDGSWQITSFNRAAEMITGVRRQEAIGRRCCDVFRASICESACVLRRTLETGKPVVRQTVYIVNAQGQRVPISISTAVLKDARGKAIGGVETFQDLTLVEELRKELRGSYSVGDIIGRSPAMQKLFALLPQVARSDAAVLIEGASGTGKELFAHALHDLSARRAKRFVAINCGALPDTLLESELFGYKAGAFTDARKDKPGRFALAEGGTLFLDEIADISPAMQARLLRVLQERVYEPLGGVEPVQANVRVIAATPTDLRTLVGTGRFREDLYYRIHVVRLVLPPLIERREDLPLLIDRCVERFNQRQGKQIAGLSAAALAILLDHDYPGNVRELENIIEHAFVLCRDGLIEPQHLPAHLRERSDAATPALPGHTLQELEVRAIAAALQRHHGNRRAAAQDLGIHPATLFRKAKALQIRLPDEDGRQRPS